MKRRVIAVGLLYAGYLAFVIASVPQLPDPVATHFDSSGQPDRWMSRSAHVAFAMVIGALPPAIMLGTMYMFRFVPSSYFSLPNRAYWLAPERRNETVEYLQRHAAWLAAVMVGFMAGVQFLIVQANSRATPASSGRSRLLVLFFLVTIVWWALSMIRRFRHIA